VHVVSVYVPNGQAVGTEPYVHKLAFLDAMRARLAALHGEPLAVMGDLNIAPTDLDVWDPAVFAGGTHVSPPERERFAALLETGLADGYRRVHPTLGPEAHTWWDYRAGAYHKRQGMRIDHALLAPVLAERLRDATVDRTFRKGSKPSDHAPLVLDLV
jgi:exodeoxyribonuclease-3